MTASTLYIEVKDSSIMCALCIPDIILKCFHFRKEFVII